MDRREFTSWPLSSVYFLRHKQRSVHNSTNARISNQRTRQMSNKQPKVPKVHVVCVCPFTKPIIYTDDFEVPRFIFIFRLTNWHYFLSMINFVSLSLIRMGGHWSSWAYRIIVHFQLFTLFLFRCAFFSYCG